MNADGDAEAQHRTSSTIGGVDYFNQENDFVSPPELEYEPNDGQPGTVVLSKSSNLNLNLAVNGNYTYTPESETSRPPPRSACSTRTAVWMPPASLGRTLLSGQENPDQAASLSVLQDDRPVQDLGIYAQEEVLLIDRRLLLTAGVRADQSSNNGDPNKFFLYPKAAACRTGSSAPSAAWTRSSCAAPTARPATSRSSGPSSRPIPPATIGGIFGTLPGNRAGDPFIKPERQTELEGGFDAQFAGGRAELKFTVYQRNISDLLLEQTLPPSQGQESGSSARTASCGTAASRRRSPLTPIQSAAT